MVVLGIDAHKRTHTVVAVDAAGRPRLAAGLTGRIGALTTGINGLEKETAVLVRQLAPSLLAIPGAAELTAAKIVGQTADVRRFKSTDAYARHNGTAPLPVWSGSQTRHRLSRTGNRQLNCAIHRIAVTQIRCHPAAQACLKTRIAGGDTKTEALRALKRRPSDIVYHALLADGTSVPLSQAA